MIIAIRVVVQMVAAVRSGQIVKLMHLTCVKKNESMFGRRLVVGLFDLLARYFAPLFVFVGDGAESPLPILAFQQRHFGRACRLLNARGKLTQQWTFLFTWIFCSIFDFEINSLSFIL